EKYAELAVLRIDEIAEHVHVAAFMHGGDLDAGHERNARFPREPRHLAGCGQRVVVGHAHRADAGTPRHVDELGGLKQTVRSSRVKVKVDQEGSGFMVLGSWF